MLILGATSPRRARLPRNSRRSALGKRRPVSLKIPVRGLIAASWPSMGVFQTRTTLAKVAPIIEISIWTELALSASFFAAALLMRRWWLSLAGLLGVALWGVVGGAA
jgi:hypothetical protein